MFLYSSLPLSEVVDCAVYACFTDDLTWSFVAFSIFHSSQGHQGFLGQPSKQQLDTDFGTIKDADVVQVILEKGKKQASDSLAAPNTTATNKSRGSGSVDVGRGNSKN